MAAGRYRVAAGDDEARRLLREDGRRRAKALDDVPHRRLPHSERGPAHSRRRVRAGGWDSQARERRRGSEEWGRAMRALCRACSSKPLVTPSVWRVSSWQLDGAILFVYVPPLVMAATSERAGGSAASIIGGQTSTTSAPSPLRAVTCRVGQRAQRPAAAAYPCQAASRRAGKHVLRVVHLVFGSLPSVASCTRRGSAHSGNLHLRGNI